MLKKSVLLFLVLMSFSLGFAQEYSVNTKIAPHQLKEDFSIMVFSLRECHPGLYDFFPKTQFDSLATANLNALTDSLTEVEFHVVVRKFLTRIRCGHTSALPSKAWYDEMKVKQKLVPVHVRLHENEFYVRAVFGDSTEDVVGSRIRSFDGIQASEVMSELRSIIERDGFGETMVNRNMERFFQTYYLFLYGMKDSYVLEVEKENGSVIEISLESQSAKRYSYEEPFDLKNVIETETAKFGILKGSNSLAVLDLKSFPNKGYKKFYREVFKRLAEMDTLDLLIDLRGNGGGYFPNGNQLLRYLMNDKFSMDFSKPNKHPKKSKYLSMSFPSKMTRFIFSTIPDRNKEDSARNYQIRYKPIKRNHFSREVYLLIDGMTFSAGSFVASKLKAGENAFVSGEETGGGEVGFNATLTWNLDLPNSHLRVHIPAYHVDVQPEMEDIGRGVMPTISVDEVFENE